MASSYTLGNHYESFVRELLATGRYASASEVVVGTFLYGAADMIIVGQFTDAAGLAAALPGYGLPAARA